MTVASGEPVAAVENLAIAIGEREVVSDVSFAVAAGECIGLVGESGSGKTVTCRALTGLLPRIGGRVVRGEVRLGGEVVTDIGQDHWRRLRGRTVALVPQASLAALDPVMRIGAQLGETIRLHDRGAGRHERALELLDQVQIDGPERVLRAYPHEISGGMRQRVMIALAIAARPQVLVVDEPTTALDVTVQAAILALLDDLRRETGLALILVTHDLAVVRLLADRVAVMYGGKLMEDGPCAEVLSRPRNPYTMALQEADPSTVPRGGDLVGLPGAPPDPREWPTGCRFAPRCPHVEAICERQAPPLETEGGRSVACLRWREVAR